MISMIASVGKNLELGKDNKLIWHIPNDMKFFKNTTMNHIVVMGWNTYKSLPNNLPGREMIVLSRSKNDDKVYIVRNTNQIVDQYKDIVNEIFIIGGANIYKQFLPYSDNLYLTEIEDFCEQADAYFPTFDKNEWEDNILLVDTYKDLDYKIHKYVRKRS